MAQEEINFPNNIRTIRLGVGMRMTELARRTKLSLSAVSKIEKGVRRVNQKQLLNICNILGCKLSDVFIKESDKVADEWQSEIKRRTNDNEDNGLKIFGTGLRKIRQKSGKTISQAAKDAKMTLSVYHKIEVGQREVYENEIEPLAKSFKFTVPQLFDEIANLYKSGNLAKQINKDKERTKSVLTPNNPASGFDLSGGLYGANLYDSARRKLAPVFGKPAGNEIKFQRDDSAMIAVPAQLEGRKGIYAVIPNTKRLAGMLPEKCHIFADSETPAAVGDMAVFIDADFAKLGANKTTVAQVAVVRTDAKGKNFGELKSPDEKITFKTMHKVVMIVME